MELITKWSPEDIRSLVLHFLDKRKDIHTDALDILSRNNFGTSTRKIMNFVDGFVASSGSQTITSADLPFEILMNGILNSVLGGDIQSYNEAKRRVLEEFERAIITKYPIQDSGTPAGASEGLKLDRPTAGDHSGNTMFLGGS